MYVVRLYAAYLRIYVRRLAEYRSDTWLGLAAGVFAQGAALIFLSALFARIPDLVGWSFWEVVFIFGFSALARSLNQALLDAPWALQELIVTGGLDVLLIRPASPLLQAIGLQQNFNGLASVFTAGAILLTAAAHLSLAWSGGRIAYLLLGLAAAQAVQFAVLLAAAVSAFWFLRVRALMYPIVWLYDLTRYPIDIFAGWLRAILVSVLPFAFAGFYPAAFVLRPQQYALWGALVPFAAAAALAAALGLWRAGLRRYESAGA